MVYASFAPIVAEWLRFSIVVAFDFPPPDFPPPVWKKPAPIEIEPTDTLESNATESTLSELFQGLVYGTPSDEKEGRMNDLNTYLDRTSVTDTLSYSDGTI